MQTSKVQGVSNGLMFGARTAAAKSSDGSFEQLMQISQKVGTPEQKGQETSRTSKKDSVTEDVNQTGKSEDSKKSEDAKFTGKTDKKPETKQKTGEISDTEAAERTAELVNQVTETVKETLGLSEEQLEALLEQLGITKVDLLNPDNLQNLVLMANDAQGAAALLTNEELLGTLQKLLEQLEAAMQEAGMDAQELSAAMDNPEFVALVTEALEQVGEAETDSTETQPELLNTVGEVSEENVVAEEKSVTIDFRAENSREDSRSADRHSDNMLEGNNQFADQFIQNLQQTQVKEVAGQTEAVSQIREIADQILEQIKVTVTPETTSLDMVLTPEELGRVNLTITEQDGVMKAKFVTENELAKEAIESNLVQFKEMLTEQGLKVESIEVMVSNFEFDNNGQAEQSNAQEEKKQGKHHFVADDGTETAEVDQLAQHFMEGGESTVNYMA